MHDVVSPRAEEAPARRGGVELLVGLHVTKCAGTSLMTTVRRELTEDQYYLCSSFHGNLVSGRPLYGDIVQWNRLRFVFGHYVNEDLLRALGPRRLHLFTILREPIERAVSHFLHLNAIRLRAGAPRLAGRDYLLQQRDTMCVELLRCFPSLAASGGSLSDQAARALAMFDHVGDSARYVEGANRLLQRLGLGPAEEVRDNVSAERLPGEEFAEDAALVRAGAAEAFAHDVLLYERARPFLGSDRFAERFAAVVPGGGRSLAQHLDSLGDPRAAAARFAATECRHLAAEMRMLGRVDWARGYLDDRIARLQELRDSL